MRIRLLVFVGLSLACHTALAAPFAISPIVPPRSSVGAEAACAPAIAAAEQIVGIPHNLLAAIGQVETGRRNPRTGQISAWPWSVDVDGQGAFYATREQAIAAVRAAQARGIRSIDVGCLQINLLHHPHAFPNLDVAFDPAANALYAARFLSQLFAQTGAWPRAAGLYHSATPAFGIPYQAKVMAAWQHPGLSDPVTAGGLQQAWAATLTHPMVTTEQAMGFLPPRRAMAGVLIGTTAAAPPPSGAPRVGTAHGLAFYRAMPVITAGRAPARFGG